MKTFDDVNAITQQRENKYIISWTKPKQDTQISAVFTEFQVCLKNTKLSKRMTATLDFYNLNVIIA